MEFHRDSEVRILKLDYMVQQDASIQYIWHHIPEDHNRNIQNLKSHLESWLHCTTYTHNY
jgi:hypothetical protein